MNRQIFIIIGFSLLCGLGFAATDSSLEGEKKPFTHSPLEFGLDLQYYAPSYKKYVVSVDDVTHEGQTTSQIGKAAQISVEWLPFGNKIGKLGIGGATGFAAITEATVYKSVYPTDPDTQVVSTTPVKVGRSAEVYVIPTQAFLSYRLDYFQNQLIVPFAKVGVSTSWIRQTVDGGESYHMGYGFEYSLGGEFCLNSLEPKAGREFDSRFGVNGTYLVAEYIKSAQLNTSSAVNLAYEAFRFGLRFEF